MDIPEARYILDKFINIKGIAIQILGEPHNDYDSSVIHVKAGKQEYYLAEADYIETDEVYARIAKENGVKVLEKVKIKDRYIPKSHEDTLNPRMIVYKPHGTLDEERTYIYGEKWSSWRYELMKIRPRNQSNEN